MPETEIPKILIRTPNWLGDLVMSTGFIRAVLDKFPQSEIDLIIKPGFETLPLPCRGKVRIFDRKKCSAGAFGKTLRNQDYNIFYVLPPSFSSAWMAFQSQIPNRVGYTGELRSWLLSSRKRHNKQPRSVHLLQEFLDLLEPELSSADYSPHLEVTEEWEEKQLQPFAGNLPESFIVLAPGAIYGQAKQWPLDSFRELAAQMQKKRGLPIIIMGTKDDVELGEKISDGLNDVLNFCGQTTLAQLLAILAKAELLVSNDSGSMHLMTALKRPQVAIFGSTSPTWTGPINPYAKVMKNKIECSPCFSRTCKFDHYKCLTQITPEEVLEQANQLLFSGNQ